MRTKRATGETKDTTNGGPICRSNRFFIQLKGYGHCDDKGRTVMGVGTNTNKLIADPDQPLRSLLLPLLEMLMKTADYSDYEAGNADVEFFKKRIKQWGYVRNGAKKTAKATP